MKKIFLAVALIIATATQAQDKIKGNRDPSTVITAIEAFNAIEIGGDFDVAIVKGITSQIEVTADSNLHQYITPTVLNGKLTITATVNIRSKKELKIRIIYPGDLATIVVKEKAYLSTLADYESQQLNLEVRDNAKIFMTAKVEKLTFYMKNKARGEVNFKGSNANVILQDNSSLKALLDYKDASLSMSSKADGRIDGDMNKATFKLESRASLNASNLIVKDLNLQINNNASAKVNAKDTFNLKSSNSANTELHNTPKINIEEFSGSSVLSKK